jgi:pimeloyl-ACP methyl ester carboxylesterase
LSCGNGFYGIFFAKKYPKLLKKLVLLQTPGFEGMRPWLKASVPIPVKIPFIGQLVVYFQRLKIPKIWFKVALPKNSPHLLTWSELSRKRIEQSCCNCLASVVQGLAAMNEDALRGCEVPTVMIWGRKDYSHRYTDEQSLRHVIPNAEILVWEDCGHFPELEKTDRFLGVIES